MTSNLKFHRRGPAAEYVRRVHRQPCSEGYLARLASAGRGPVFSRLDGYWPVYHEDDLDTWARSRISGPHRKASEQKAAGVA
jgi:hypothetical protein